MEAQMQTVIVTEVEKVAVAALELLRPYER